LDEYNEQSSIIAPEFNYDLNDKEITKDEYLTYYLPGIKYSEANFVAIQGQLDGSDLPTWVSLTHKAFKAFPDGNHVGEYLVSIILTDFY